MELLLEHFPEHSDVNHLYAGLLSSTQKFPLAIEHYKKALQAKPENAYCWHDLGAAYAAIAQIDDAILSYKQAITLNPNYYQDFFNLALVLRDTEQLSSALAYCAKALSVKPDCQVVRSRHRPTALKILSVTTRVTGTTMQTGTAP